MTKVYIGIATNADRAFHVRSALEALRERFGLLQVSSVYESPDIGMSGGPFYNLAVGLDASEELISIGFALREIEIRHGRKRGNGSTHTINLDLDLLLYGDEVVQIGPFTVPHVDLDRYAFALCPLAEIAAEVRHPVTGCKLAACWAAFEKNAQPLKAVALDITGWQFEAPLDPSASPTTGKANLAARDATERSTLITPFDLRDSTAIGHW